jgi:hypothetical protein
LKLGGFHDCRFRLFHDPLFRRTRFNQHIDGFSESRVILDGIGVNPGRFGDLGGGYG